MNHVTHLKHRKYKVQPLQIQTLVLPILQIMRIQHQWDPSTPKKIKTLRIQSKQHTQALTQNPLCSNAYVNA